MTRRKYAEATNVSPEESKSAINNILKSWGVRGIQWSEMFDTNKVVLQFLWSPEGVDQHYMARMDVNLPTDDDLREEAKHKRSGRVIEDKFERLVEQRGWREHRVLHIFLKGAFEAIENGIITAAQLFLPWLVGRDGRTVGEVVGEQLPLLMNNSATALLPTSRRDGVVGDES